MVVFCWGFLFIAFGWLVLEGCLAGVRGFGGLFFGGFVWLVLSYLEEQ